MANRHPSKPFTKGDPRINRLGRPKTFTGFRALAKEISHEIMRNPETGEVEDYEGQSLTIAEKILRDWAKSDSPVLQQAFVAYAFGKVPDHDIVEQSGEVVIRVLNSADPDSAEVVPDAPATEADFVEDDESDSEDVDG